MPAFSTPDPIRATLDVFGAVLRVRATDRDDTVVSVRPHNEASTADRELAEQTTVAYDAGRLTIRSNRNTMGRLKAMLGSGNARLDIDLDLPSGSALELRGWGDTTLDGGYADVEIDIQAGDIRIGGAQRLRAKTSMGEIRVAVVHGDADLNTSAGSIHVERAGAELRAKTSMGDVVVGEGAGELRLSTSMGDVRVERALGTVRAKTSAGDVRVGSVRSGSVDLDTTYGQLDVGIAHGTAAWLDVDAKHGAVRSDLESSDGPGDAESTVEIRAHSGFGDITLRRVPA